jgi:hypothetical protein
MSMDSSNVNAGLTSFVANETPSLRRNSSNWFSEEYRDLSWKQRQVRMLNARFATRSSASLSAVSGSVLGRPGARLAMAVAVTSSLLAGFDPRDV